MSTFPIRRVEIKGKNEITSFEAGLDDFLFNAVCGVFVVADLAPLESKVRVSDPIHDG